MTFHTFTFYAFAAILVFAALRVVTARNPVHSVLFLITAFFSAAGLVDMTAASASNHHRILISTSSKEPTLSVPESQNSRF